MSDSSKFRPNSAVESRLVHAPHHLRVLFVGSEQDSVNLCVTTLQTSQYVVDTFAARTLADCTEILDHQAFDLVIAEYPSLHWHGSRDLRLLHQTMQGVPLLFLITRSGNESAAELTGHGTFDHLERMHIVQLPMLVRRILNEKQLRIELEEAGTALEHSESQYRALVDNPAYGILRCGADGEFFDVNDALLAMLGYPTKDELLAASRSTDVFFNLGLGAPHCLPSPVRTRIEPVEVEWKRKNGTTLRARICGRAVNNNSGQLLRYEVIVVDITAQRELENQLRREASSDSLTGLANRRNLFELLHAEISRSRRTGREFCFVLLDMNGLKEINDRYGHAVGDQALCRLAHILTDCSRSVDVAARQGGDEFSLILPETGLASAVIAANRICELLTKDREEPPISVCFGIASFPRDADSIAPLIHAADVALYNMKSERPKKASAALAS